MTDQPTTLPEPDAAPECNDGCTWSTSIGPAPISVTMCHAHGRIDWADLTEQATRYAEHATRTLRAVAEKRDAAHWHREFVTAHRERNALLKLRDATLDLHQPIAHPAGYTACAECTRAGDACAYPCPTVHALTEYAPDSDAPTWRDYAIEHGSVTCGSDGGCDYSFSGDEDQHLELGEAVDWAKAHVAEHAEWDAASAEPVAGCACTPDVRCAGHAIAAALRGTHSADGTQAEPSSEQDGAAA